MITTDLNQRERQRYATSLRTISTAADKLATYLEVEDDQSAVVQLIMLSLRGRAISELLDVFQQAAKAEVAARDLDTGISGLDAT